MEEGDRGMISLIMLCTNPILVLNSVLVQKLIQKVVFLVRRRSGRVCAQIRPGRQGEAVYVDLDETEVEHVGNFRLT